MTLSRTRRSVRALFVPPCPWRAPYGRAILRLMQGSVRRHNGGSYRITFDIGRNADGTRRQYRKGGFRTKAEAQAALETANMRFRSGQRMDIDDLTFEQWLNTWLA